MHWSPDELTALGNSRLYEIAGQSRQIFRSPPLRTALRRTPGSPRMSPDSVTRPDYGCVDWFVYEEHHQRPEQEGA